MTIHEVLANAYGIKRYHRAASYTLWQLGLDPETSQQKTAMLASPVNYQVTFGKTQNPSFKTQKELRETGGEP